LNAESATIGLPLTRKHHVLICFAGFLLVFFCVGWISEAVWNRGLITRDLVVPSAALLALAWISGVACIKAVKEMLRSSNRKRNFLLWPFWCAFLPVATGYVAGIFAHDNLRCFSPGQAFRAGQMSSPALAACFERYGIKSVLSLRGADKANLWYRAEIATCAKFNVSHFDFGLLASREVLFTEMDGIVRLLKNAPKPILIHCDGGADRSGLVAALYCFAIDEQSPLSALKELSVLNGHVPLIRPKVSAMDRSFWNYVTNRSRRIETNLEPSRKKQDTID
jgi:hypothetical protein